MVRKVRNARIEGTLAYDGNVIRRKGFRVGIWADHFHPRVLLRWEVFGWIIGTLLAVGGIVLVFDQFFLANVFFVAVAVFLFVKIVHSASSSRGNMIGPLAFAFVLCGLAGAGITATVRGVNAYRDKKARGAEGPSQTPEAPNPSAPNPQNQAPSPVAPNSHNTRLNQKPVHATPPVTVTGVQVTQTLAVGKKIVLNLLLQNNTGAAFEMKTLTVTGIQPFYGDAARDKQIEDYLWQIVESKNGTQTPLILPSRVTDMAFTAETISLTQDLISDLQSQARVAYFLIQFRDMNGAVVLDFCGHTNSDNRFDYCRSHNGP